jgi:hypothetical protein
MENLNMVGYSKSSQIGKAVNPKKVKADGTKVSRTREWELARAKLKVVYQSRRITRCEFVSDMGEKCTSSDFLSFAHRNKRRNLEPGDLGSFTETLLLCQNHHDLIEGDKDETDRLFKLLRPL